MRNGADITNDYNDACPVHGAGECAHYEFGQFRDATITTFYGCACVVLYLPDPAGCRRGRVLYYERYGKAECVAEMQKACNAVKYA